MGVLKTKTLRLENERSNLKPSIWITLAIGQDSVILGKATTWIDDCLFLPSCIKKGNNNACEE